MWMLHRTLLFVLTLIAAGPVTAQGFRDDSAFESLWTPFEGTQPAHWRVVWHTDPRTAASVSWSTRDAGTVHRVHLRALPADERLTGPATDPTSYASVHDAAVSGPFTPSAGDGESDGPLGSYHHVRLTELVPGTRYAFLIESDGQFSPPLEFRTAPASGADLAFVYGGDSRTGWRDRCRVNLMIAELATRHPDLLCFVHGGDFVERGSASAQWLRWLSHHELTTTADGRVLPIVPARGNHDWGPGYAEVFDSPGRTGTESGGAWFRTDLGAGVCVLNLDTNVPALGDQLEWLESELPLARRDARWLLLNYHRPLFPAVKSPAAMAPYWAPLFERNDVDLVFESDGHCIKRTLPIRDGAVDPTGVTYVGEGGLGVPQRKPNPSHWYFADGAFTGRGHHVTLVTASAESLHVETHVLRESDHTLEGAMTLIERGAQWSYLAGSDPEADWASTDFDSSTWKVGPAGFGYGDGDDATVLDDMRHGYDRVYLRATFDVDPAALAGSALALSIDFDDGFVAHLNGVEVARSGVTSGNGPRAEGVVDHEAGTFETMALRGATTLLRPTGNVLAIEGHNISVSSNDFSLHPSLLVAPLDALDPLRQHFDVVDDHTLRVRAKQREGE
ncbi:Calcineurin-like phosphoesterase [Planctomycetes bacterium Pla163]|uniref:Calcineurin-like phosphoesterase n=1 Tax=Rohdeia mirabilis TaxID=2528008 RepID=A0A518CX45_9BACT|nr:Calcineurin-like phosphoesterase [Planctomycetes bacterium Pla163]